MWPMYVDYSDDECRRVLRSLELEAYAAVVNAFRAQGALTKERKKLLQDLCFALSISIERHRAEIRRAVNDEHLNTIAERLSGPNTATEWAIEGRRLVPLMPRLAPQTAFTAIADSVANAQAAKNATLPLPGKTGCREMSNGGETMVSRKRKELPTDSTESPSKMSAPDNQYLNSLLPFESTNSSVPEPSQQPVSQSCESFPVTESVSQVSSCADFNAPKSMSVLTTCVTSASSPIKSSPKQVMLKSSSTVTTFSSFDQLSTNLLASRPTSLSSVVTTVAQEEQVSAVSDVKTSCELKTTMRLSPSVSSMKPLSSVTTVSTPCTSSATTERVPLTSASSPSSSNKFLTQIRPKTPGHGRQNVPSSLGLKLGPQPQISPRTLSPKSSNAKVKQENTTHSFFTKKPSPSVFSSPNLAESQAPQFPLPTVSETLATTKSPVAVSKSVTKTESPTVTSQQSNTKVTTVPKSFPKTSAYSSQYISRSLFSSASKGTAKSLPPVIFNVSSTSCTPLQTTTKTTGSIQSETGKPTPQLLPKSTNVGISHSLKLSTSNTQTIQYRNDGGMVRSARIVNISQPVGSRLPCAISPSAISALGLTSNLTSTALRVTLPAGTLSTSSSVRVSAAAKPNVIVVHKAQMWPRTQGAAVIMSSSGTLPKLSSDVVQETIALSQKEKSRPSSGKFAPRPIAPARPQSPAVSVATLKVPDTNLVPNPLVNKTSTSDSPVPSDNLISKSSESSNETQCKRNLLADIIEASGILLDNSSSEKSPVKKSDESRPEKELTYHQETDLKNTKSSKSCPSSESSVSTQESTNVTSRPVKEISDDALSSEMEKNVVDNKKQGDAQVESTEVCN
ncbi:Protein EMSY, partial [Stegodyphus mimosarum]